MSGNAVWASNAVTGWTSNTLSSDYGIWSENLTLTGGPDAGPSNEATHYIGNYAAAAPPPTAQPQANTFRIYLPTSAGAAPVKPFVTQNLAFVSGANPPVYTTPTHTTTTVQVEINVFNPTPWAITFSASNLVTANVPGGQILYAGSASTTVSQGSVTAQPGVGGSGNITWNPGTVAAGATAKLTYQVNVTPTAAGTISITGTPASNGTTATYVDETGNTTQALATYTFGPLCQLAITTGTSLPTLAVISSFDAHEENGQAVVEWKTASEVGTAGFYLLRQDKETGDYKQINKRLLPGLINSPHGGTYRLVDHGASLSEGANYKLVEIESKGRQRIYGPFSVGTDSKQFALKSPQKADRTVLYKPEVLSEGTVSDYSRVPHGISEAQTDRIKARKEAQRAVQVLKKGSVGAQAKISVSEAGLYYLNASDISGVLGISQQSVTGMIKNNLLSLQNQGQSVAYISDPQNSGIYFYGLGIDSIYTLNNIYWLRQAKGLAMAQVEGKGPSPAAGNETFSETLHFEENNIDAPGLFQDPNADYWFWDYIVAGDPEMGSKDFTLRTDGAASIPDQASITIRLHGATDSGVANEHHAVFTLNGTEIGETLWEGIAEDDHTVTLSFSQGILNDGDNTLEVTGVLGPGVPYSIFFINSFDLTYQRLYQAVGNTLLLRGDTNQVVSVSGFTDPDILLFDVTTSNTPGLINATTIDGTDGNYRLSFNPASSNSVYLAISRDAVNAGPDMWADTPSSLQDKNNKADYLVITTSGLSGAAQSLAAYRKGQGFAAMVVNQEDIMDEFNYGIYSPAVIRDFLSYAYNNWKKAPKYVVLAGDGSYDYKNNLGYGDSLIPPIMVGTPDGLFPSDNSLADINGDHLPEMAIGRLPVSTPQDLQGMISKIIAYEAASNGVWGKTILMLADIPEAGGAFTDESDQLAALLPKQYTPVKIYLSEDPLDEARSLLLNAINNGVGAMNYIGHGGVDRLSSGGLLVSGDVSTLTNVGKYPLVTAFTCVVGQFAIPGVDCLAEDMVLKQKGGAVAVWAPTGISIDSEAAILDRMFFQYTFGAGNHVLGDIIIKALKDYENEGTEPYMMDIYNLLGDPALRIRSK